MLIQTDSAPRAAREPARTLAVGIALMLLGCFLLPAAETNAPRTRIRAGLTYQPDTDPDKPWSIHIARLDLSRSDYVIATTVAQGTNFGMNTLSAQIKALPSELGRPIAAVNGDFYREKNPYQGDPSGLQILQGELISSPGPNSAFWIDAQGRPQMTNVLSHLQATWPGGESILFAVNSERPGGSAVLYTSFVGASTQTEGGREIILERAGSGDWLPLRPGRTYTAKVRELRDAGNTPLAPDIMVLSLSPDVAARLPKVEPGEFLKISTATIPDLAGVQTAIGGGPALVRGGQVTKLTAPFPRHPRTALGWNKDFLYLLEVDGRQSNLSIGMTFPELAAYFVKLGCTEAINLDGGGSATFWLHGQIVNSPCYGHERPVANGLVILRKKEPPAP